jgi:hypothetical protein
MKQRVLWPVIVALTLALLVFSAIATPAMAAGADPKPIRDNPNPARQGGVKIVPGSELDVFYQAQLAQIRKLEIKYGGSTTNGTFQSQQQYDQFLLHLSRLSNVRVRDFTWSQRMYR